MAGRTGAPPDGIPGGSDEQAADPAVGWRGAAPPAGLWPGGPPAGPMGSLLAAAGAWPRGPAATGLGAGASGAASGVAAAGVWPSGPAAAGLGAGSWPGGVMPGGGGWQEWLAVAAALGFQADPGAWPDGVNTGAAASAASSEARAQDRLPSAPGATSAPVVAASARRRGGRAPRPPPSAPAPPPASEHIDLTDDRNEADWCDENLRIVCEIFAEEVQKGNRANTHLNKGGYKNVIASFKQRTGLDYTRIQFVRTVMKWRVLLKMPSYPMDKQKMIVAATMCLHNYIRENSDEDEDFRKCDRDPDYVPTIPKRYRRQNAGDTSTSETDDRNMDKFRDNLARAIFLARSS